MPRLSTMIPLAALAIFASASLPMPTYAVDNIAIGAACGNADTCINDGVCVLNYCVTKASLENTGSSPINGETNKCSADDCCAAGLDCLDAAGQIANCWRKDQGPSQLTPVACTGQPRSINDTNSATASTDMPTLPAGTSGIGQKCSETSCCSGSNVCYDQSRVCGPKIPGLGTVGCNGQTSDSDTDIPPKSCSVNSPCEKGQTCLGNLCVADNLVPSGTSWGLGNACSADVCCPNNYVCLLNAGSRCGPQLTSALGTVKCTASGSTTSGQTITSDGNVPAITPISASPAPQDSAASSLSFGVANVALLAGAALVMALLA